MANKKISQLNEATTIADGDLFAVVQGGETKKVTKAILLATVNSLIAAKADTSFVAAALAGKEPANANIQAHIASTSNPHSVTKTQVGLGNVANSLQLIAANNLSDLVNPATARTSLGLGTMATQNAASYLPLTGGTLTGGLTVSGADITGNNLYSVNNIALGSNRDKRKVQQDFKTKNNADAGGVDWTWYADADNAVVGNMQLTLYGYPRRTTDGVFYGFEPFIKYSFPTFNGSSSYTKQITNEAFTLFNQAVKIKSGNIGLQPLIVQAESGHTANLTEWLNSAGTVLASINAAGRLGIRTNNPQNFLHVIGDASNTGITIETTNGDGASLFFKGSSGTSQIAGGDNGNSFYFKPAGTNPQTFYVNSNGITSIAVAADATNTIREAAQFIFRSRYWNGTSNADHEARIRHTLESTAPLSRLGLLVASTEWLSIKSDGKVGIGTTAPTARFHLPAGTASPNTAPLKFTAGTNLTTPENGAMEYDNTHLYFTIGTNRYQIDQQGDTTINTTVTANSTLNFGYTEVNSATNTTQTLPTAVGNSGKRVIVKNINTGIVTIATTSSQTIDGLSTQSINVQNDSLTLISNGANWRII